MRRDTAGCRHVAIAVPSGKFAGAVAEGLTKYAG
jgi:hypothetical protein